MALTVLVASGGGSGDGDRLGAGGKTRSLGLASPSRRLSTPPIRATLSWSGEFTEEHVVNCKDGIKLRGDDAAIRADLPGPKG